MIADDPILRQQINKLIANRQNPVHWSYTAVFIDENNIRYQIHNVLGITTIAKYKTAISDYVFIKIDVFKSVYLHLLSTNRSLLKLELTKISTSVTGKITDGASRVVKVYNVDFANLKNEAIETRSGGLTGKHTDDLGQLVELTGQLLELGLTEFRRWMVSGVYRNIDVKTLLQGVMSRPMEAFKGRAQSNYHVNIDEPDNKSKQYQIVVPDGITLQDFPAWLQKNIGIYSSGVGYYLQGGMWYIYPLHNLKRYDKITARMTIINLPRNEMLGITNSYILEGTELYVYATGDTQHIDMANAALDKSGTGYISAKLGNVGTRFTTSEKGSTKIEKGRNRVVVNFNTNATDVDNIKPTKTLLSSNPWSAASKILENMGNIIVVDWESSNPDLLRPGMPVKFIYKNLDKVTAIYGILLGAATDIVTHRQSVLDTRYVSNTKLTIFSERVNK